MCILEMKTFHRKLMEKYIKKKNPHGFLNQLEIFIMDNDFWLHLLAWGGGGQWLRVLN